MEGALRNEFVQSAGTVLTALQRFIGEFLPGLFNPATLFTFIFVNGHLGTPFNYKLLSVNNIMN
jgi:hypothetical protein